MVKISNQKTLQLEAKSVLTEKNLGLQLPDSYKKSLSLVNGGKAAPNRLCVNSKCDLSLHEFLEVSNIPVAATAYPELLLDGFVPFAMDHGGSYFFIGCKGLVKGKVFFGDHDTVNASSDLELIASNFEAFLDSIVSFDWSNIST